ncbi:MULTISPECIES: RagB/SusD family nutrient uptake outer membrane protein [unclassified Sphingobacterium]|uniref:RagB/SusD family nutrient uptake outer membrane protein n=1 Tax=unclassified Sphingobacterium TaxID=2609468 RepID=UPI0025FD692D|nr:MULTISPECIES: RagB/SusD family nutrient uptake outer membrane protein [unclassified Sphingobacterium]
MKKFKNITSRQFFGIGLSFILLITSCSKEYMDPSRASNETALGTSQGLTAVAIGLQRVYTLGRTGVLFNSVAANGFVTNEFQLLNAGNIPELQLSTGGSAVDGTNTILANLWTSSNKIVYDADLVLQNADRLGDKKYAAGLIAYTSIFKALAIGNMAQYWENVPDGTGNNVSFIDRKAAFTKAINLLDNALNIIAANAISAEFLNNVPVDLNIINTIHALKARYALFSENYTLAYTEANLVDLTKPSFFKFDAISPNILFTIISSNNVFQPQNINLGLTGAHIPDAADKRITFYTKFDGSPATIRMRGFATATTSPFPIYLPGEMILIKAEVLARQNNTDDAVTELNKVITKTPESDTQYGLGAALPALSGTFTQQQVLNLIYKHRCIELYASGLKIEDMRRFNQPTADRKRNFFPYPFQERDNNTNTPADPSF